MLKLIDLVNQTLIKNVSLGEPNRIPKKRSNNLIDSRTYVIDRFSIIDRGFNSDFVLIVNLKFDTSFTNLIISGFNLIFNS